jgi:hypothetical protein
MQKLMMALMAVSTLAFAGCKKKGGGGEMMEKMESFQKQMCDCKDKACADKVQEEMGKWGTEMAKTAKPADDKPDPDMVKKSGEIMTKYTECMTKLMSASMGGDMKGGDMKGGDMKGGDMKGGDMKGGDDMKGSGDMKGSDMKGGGDMKGSDMKGSDDKKM